MIGYTIVGGFLGSGKTTLINGMLELATQRLAVIVNDIGELNIDAALIRSRRGDAESGETVELTNGCVCCSIGDSLAVTLRDLCVSAEPPDHIVLECSGAADPAAVTRYGSRRVLDDPSVIITVDATDIVERSADIRFRDLVRAQLESADLLAVTKTDLVDDAVLEDELTGWLRERSDAEVVIAHPRLLGEVTPTPGRRHRPASVDAGALRTELVTFGSDVEVDTVAEVLGTIPGLVRAKGVIDTPEGAVLIQWSAGRLTHEPWPWPDPPMGVVTIR